MLIFARTPHFCSHFPTTATTSTLASAADHWPLTLLLYRTGSQMRATSMVESTVSASVACDKRAKRRDDRKFLMTNLPSHLSFQPASSTPSTPSSAYPLLIVALAPTLLIHCQPTSAATTAATHRPPARHQVTMHLLCQHANNSLIQTPVPCVGCV